MAGFWATTCKHAQNFTIRAITSTRCAAGREMVRSPYSLLLIRHGAHRTRSLTLGGINPTGRLRSVPKAATLAGFGLTPVCVRDNNPRLPLCRVSPARQFINPKIRGGVSYEVGYFLSPDQLQLGLRASQQHYC